MRSLLAGYRAFRKDIWPSEAAHFAALVKGQKPHTLVISCCDSRVDPATIFGARPGELFVIRNVASVVPPFDTHGGYHGVSAAIAFAVVNLKVERIVVLGHEHCGGVEAAMSENARNLPTPFLSEWISLLEPAIHACGGGTNQLAVEQESIRLSLGRLMSFPFIAERVQQGTLQLAGMHFKISNGTLSLLDEATQAFRLVDDAAGTARDG